MADAELVKTLDYILNRCDEAAIEVLAGAVVRRRRELTMFGGKAKLPNPGKMAKELAGQINIEGLRSTIKDMAVRIIKEHAPELNEAQIAELSAAWIPEASGAAQESSLHQLPPDLLSVMIRQFIDFSRGAMSGEEDKKLRAEMNDWPQRYWKAFPEIIRILVKELLDGEIGDDEFNTKLLTALSLH
jgi:hypothetical protein